MSRQLLRWSSALVFLVVVLAASALPSESRNVPSSGHSGGHSSGSSGSRGHSSAPPPSGARHVPTRSTAEANHAGGYHGYPYYPYYPYYSYYWDWPYSPYWSMGVWWGWPGYWGDGSWYGYPGGYPSAYPGYVAEFPQGPAIVETDVLPKKAQLVLDGEAIGEARDFNGHWDVLHLEPGRHTLQFSAAGYMTLEVGVEARAGRHYRIDYELQRGEGKDARSATVLDAATEPAPAPLAPASPSAPPGPATPGAPDERSASTMRRGFLKVFATPADAAVYLDGEFLGSAEELSRLHGAIPVATGEHRVEVVRPGYLSRATVVTVGDGQKPAEARIDLEREGRSAL
jgi:hypothetical protein